MIVSRCESVPMTEMNSTNIMGQDTNLNVWQRGGHSDHGG